MLLPLPLPGRGTLVGCTGSSLGRAGGISQPPGLAEKQLGACPQPRDAAEQPELLV